MISTRNSWKKERGVLLRYPPGRIDATGDVAAVDEHLVGQVGHEPGQREPGAAEPAHRSGRVIVGGQAQDLIDAGTQLGQDRAARRTDHYECMAVVVSLDVLPLPAQVALLDATW